MTAESQADFDADVVATANKFNRGRRWRRVAKGFVVAGTLATFALNGSAITAALPGPPLIRAILLAQLAVVGSLLGTVPLTAADALAERRLLGARGYGAQVSMTFLAVPMVVLLVTLVFWPLLGWTDTVAVLVAPRVLFTFALLSLAGLAGRRAGEALGDKALAQRLTRFAREAGVRGAKVRVVGDPTDRSRKFGRVPRVDLRGTEIGGQYVSLPAELLNAPPGVIEADLARAIICIRRRVTGRRILRSSALDVVILLVVAWLAEDTLVRLAGASSAGDPDFVAMAALLLILARVLTRPLTDEWNRREDRRLLGMTMDLTRDPDSVEAAARYAVNAWYVDPSPPLIGPLRGLLGEEPLSPAEQVAVAEAWRSRQRVALLFTDVVGSTEFVNRLGDRRWNEVLADHDHVLREAAASRGGREIDNPGDGFVFEFSDVGQALLAARDAQQGLTRVEVEPGRSLPVRMGVHAGDVIRRGSTLVGREMHVASRISAAANAGEILVSDGIPDELSSAGRFQFGTPRTVALKGFEGDQVVFPLDWNGSREGSDGNAPDDLMLAEP